MSPFLFALNILDYNNISIGDAYVMVYVVQSGDSLYKIAQKFNTTVESIYVLNNLRSNVIYPDQRLNIPLYTEAIVRVGTANIRSGPGTNYSILTTMTRDARLPVTQTTPEWLRVRLYNGNPGWISRQISTFRTYDDTKPILGIVGFYVLEESPGLPSSYNSFVRNTWNLSEVPLFFYRFKLEDPGVIEKFGSFSDQDVRTLVSIGHRQNVMMLPVIHNLLYKPGGQVAGREAAKLLVTNPSTRTRAINNIISLLKQFNFDGVNIDIEDVFYEDREQLSEFYIELGKELKKEGLFFSASIPSRVSDEPFNPFSDPFDYAAIGSVVDQFIVMLYNEHGWPGSPPGSAVSAGWMERVLKYTLTRVPAEKIIAAISVFGFDFNLSTGKNTYVSYQLAIALARRYNARIIFDDASKTPYFRYSDESGNSHEVWFENEYSILAKINITWYLGISGTALWRLGMESPGIWPRISSQIIVKKF